MQNLRFVLITAQEATSMKDMGKVMNSLRPLIAGRADPAQVSAKIKLIQLLMLFGEESEAYA